MAAGRTALASGDIQRELWPDAAVERLRFRRAPLLAAAILFALGVVLARNWQPAIVLLIALLLLVGLALLGLRRQAWTAVVAVAGVWVVIGLWCAEVQPAVKSQQGLLSYADSLSRTVRGRVVRVRELPFQGIEKDDDSDPTTWVEGQQTRQPGAVSVDLAVESIENVTPDVAWMAPATGGVRITLSGVAPALRCGDIIEAPLRMKEPERYRDPGAWQYADYLLEQGIGAHASVKAARVMRMGKNVSTWDAAGVQCQLYAAQAWAAGRMTGYAHSRANHVLPRAARLGIEDAGMLNAMLFGDRTRLSHALRLGFERTGSFHLFVVSGMHVALLAGALFWLARKLRLGEWAATLLTIALTGAYALLTGFGAPVQRALAMASIFLIARLLSRERNVLNALGAAALGVLVGSPRSLFEPSFQMTFLAIVAIAGIAVPLAERTFLPFERAARKIHDSWLDIGMPPQRAQFRVMLRMWDEALGEMLGHWVSGAPAAGVRWGLWAVELALVGLVAEMVMVLPMALYFHRATVFALPANMLSIPLVTILAPVAVLTFIASLISPWLAMLPGAGTALLLHGIVGLISRVSRVQMADARVPGPVWWMALGVVGCWAFCCWAVRRSSSWTWMAVGVLPLAAAVVLWPEPVVQTPGVLEVSAIDVGQGDSILICGPLGQTMLVDAGGPTGAVKETTDATSNFDVGEEIVSPYLWSRRIRRLDVVALSHAHSDHLGGMAAVMRSFRPRELWVSIDPESTAYQSLLLEAKDLDVVVRHFHAGQSFEWSGTQVDVLAPEANYENRGAPVNNDSLVLRLEFGRASVLLEGDAEAASERAMLADGSIRPVTLLKVGHHGSRTSSTAEFFTAAAPRDAVISVGKDNTFGHPRLEVIKRIAAAGTRLYRTDEFGLTTFLLGRDGSIREITGAAD